jgi:hypothetical protein
MLSIVITHAHFAGFIAGVALVTFIILVHAIMDWITCPEPDDEWVRIIRETHKQNPVPPPPTPPPHLGDGD